MSEALVNGRKIVLAHAIFNFYETTSDGKLTLDDITATLYLGGATAAFFISDPEMRALGTVLPSKTPTAIMLYLGHRILQDAGYYDWESQSDQMFFSGVNELMTITPSWMLSQEGQTKKETQPSHRLGISGANMFSNVAETTGTIWETYKLGSRRIRLPNYRQ